MSTERRVAVITGASQGIGAGLVRGFLDRGYQVVANSRSIQPGPSADVLAIAGDIADPQVAGRVIAAAVERFGRVDTLVNNAGVFVAKPFTDYTEADYAHVTGVNLAGFFHVTQRAIRQMLAQGGGHVVNLTTTLVGQPVKAVPAALASLTKGGLDAVTRALAIEYADRGIRVNGIGPGATVTPINRAWIDDPVKRAAVEEHIPMRRAGDADEMAGVTCFLASDLAAYITGQTIFVDGGLTLFPSFATPWSSE